jgi:hypothetical protein
MNKDRAERRIQRKRARLMPCPFCGKVPVLESYVQPCEQTGYIGHFAILKPCCVVLRLGRTELFYTKPGAKPNFRLWWGMASRLVNDWNRRAPH